MDLDDVALLTGAAGRALLATLPPYDEQQVLELADRLRRQGHDPAVVAAVLTQGRLRTRAARRWRDEATTSWLLFTPAGAEQATRPQVAQARADRFAKLGEGAPAADLGCGIGVDSLALDRVGLRVDAYDSDHLTAQVAAANVDAAPWGSRVQVTVADVTSAPMQRWQAYRAAFADPARRRGGRRLFSPEQWSPPLSWVLALPVPSLGVKVAPGLDHGLVPHDAELAVVSDHAEVVEAALYRGELRPPGVRRSALLLPGGHRVTDQDLPPAPPEAGPVGPYLHEPDGAVIRAGLVAAVVAAVDGRLVDPQIAYLTTDRPVTSPFLTSYAVREVMPFSLKGLRSHLRAQHVGRVVLKKRGSAVDLEDLRRRLRLDQAQPGRRTVLLTRVGSEPLAVVAVPMDPQES